MSKRIFKVIIFLAILGFGINLYAEAPEDIQYTEEEKVSVEIQGNKALEEEKKQLGDLFIEVKEIVKAAEVLKKENTNLRAELAKLKDAKEKLGAATRELSLKNQELEQTIKKGGFKEADVKLRAELAKLKDAKAKLEADTREQSLKNQELEQAIKKDNLKQEVANLKAELAKQKDLNLKIETGSKDLASQNQKLELTKKEAQEAAEGLKKENAGFKVDLVKLKDFSAKNQELELAKKNALEVLEGLKKENADLKAELAKLKEAKEKLEADARELNLEQTIKKGGFKEAEDRKSVV